MFILPVEIDNPIRHRPDVLFIIIGINVIVYLATLLVPDKSNLFHTYGFVPRRPTIDTALSSMFLHAGFFHILGNMFFFWMFGDNVEDVIGRLFFLFSYLVVGAGALVAYYALHPKSFTPVVGASGAISGIVGMYLVFFPKARVELCFYLGRLMVWAVEVTAVIAIATWFGEQLLLTFLIEATALTKYVGTAFSAHVGGFFTGVTVGLLFRGLGFLSRYNAKRKRHWLFGYVT